MRATGYHLGSRRGRELRLEEGAEILRELLTDAVRERLDPSRPTSVWLSGGWDSPAVFGAAMLATHGDVDRIRAVSITYPVGDPGREDELIASIAGRWGATPHWVNSGDIRLLDDLRAGAAGRSEPFAHVFEHWNRALARGSRATGTHVALHGNGGDQLFQVSLIYLADLLRQGRIREVAEECRARGVRDVRTLFRWAVQPLLPSFAHRGATMLRRGRRLRHYLEREVPSWIEASFAQRHGLRSGAARVIERENGESFSSVEGRHYLSHPYFPRVYACVSELARDEGVEVRSPLLDARVIAFASERPREERASRAETKRALRAAMRGIIPNEVLAPRRARTGTTGRLFGRALRDGGGELLDDVTRESRLADLGLVDPKKLREGWRQWLATGDGNLGVALFLTVQTEFWLRAEEARAECEAVASCRAHGRGIVAVRQRVLLVGPLGPAPGREAVPATATKGGACVRKAQGRALRHFQGADPGRLGSRQRRARHLRYWWRQRLWRAESSGLSLGPRRSSGAVLAPDAGGTGPSLHRPFAARARVGRR